MTARIWLGEGWNVVDGFYFAVCTLNTSSIADPNLTLTHEALKLFTVLYVLTGIGILVELARQLGVGFVKEREQKHATRRTRRHPTRWLAATGACPSRPCWRSAVDR